MERRPVFCTFVYTTRVFRRALFNHFCIKGIRQWLVIAMVFYCFICSTDLYSRFSSGGLLNGPAINWNAILMAFGIDFLGTIGFFLLFMPLFVMLQIRAFRGGPVFGKKMHYTLGEKALSLKAEHLKTKLDWEMIFAARESSDGFMFFLGTRKKTFHWLPKDGFASPEDIDRCRALIRENIKDFQSQN